MSDTGKQIDSTWSIIRMTGAGVDALYSSSDDMSDPSKWHPYSELQSDDKYMKMSTDGGITWDGPFKIVGEDGYNTKALFLYQRSETKPTSKPASLTYSFINDTLTGDLGDWVQSEDEISEDKLKQPLYFITYNVHTKFSQVVISSSNWSEITQKDYGNFDEEDMQNNSGLVVRATSESFIVNVNSQNKVKKRHLFESKLIAKYGSRAAKAIISNYNKDGISAYPKQTVAEDGTAISSDDGSFVISIEPNVVMANIVNNKSSIVLTVNVYVENIDDSYGYSDEEGHDFADGSRTVEETTTLTINFNISQGNHYYGRISSISAIPTLLSDDDFFTWTGTTGTYTVLAGVNNLTVSLKQGCVYFWNGGGWSLDESVVHFGNALSDILKTNSEMLAQNNSQVTEYFDNVVANNIFTDTLAANKVFVDKLVANDAFIKNLTSRSLTIGYRDDNGTLHDGSIQSLKYEDTKGEEGWLIDSDGNAIFNNGTFKGNIVAQSLTIGKSVLDDTLKNSSYTPFPVTVWSYAYTDFTNESYCGVSIDNAEKVFYKERGFHLFRINKETLEIFDHQTWNTWISESATTAEREEICNSMASWLTANIETTEVIIITVNGSCTINETLRDVLAGFGGNNRDTWGESNYGYILIGAKNLGVYCGVEKKGEDDTSIEINETLYKNVGVRNNNGSSLGTANEALDYAYQAKELADSAKESVKTEVKSVRKIYQFVALTTDSEGKQQITKPSAPTKWDITGTNWTSGDKPAHQDGYILFSCVQYLKYDDSYSCTSVDVDSDSIIDTTNGFIRASLIDVDTLKATEGLFENIEVTGFLTSNSTHFQPVASITLTYKNGPISIASQNIKSLSRITYGKKITAGVYLIMFKKEIKLMTHLYNDEHYISLYTIGNATHGSDHYEVMVVNNTWQRDSIENMNEDNTMNNFLKGLGCSAVIDDDGYATINYTLLYFCNCNKQEYLDPYFSQVFLFASQSISGAISS